MADINDYKRLPDLLKHCTMAVYGKMPGSKQEKILSAFNIARGHLTKYGYLWPGSEIGEVKNISLTTKGTKRSRIHKAEGTEKSKSFDSFIGMLIEANSLKESSSEKPTGVFKKLVNKIMASIAKPFSYTKGKKAEPGPGSKKSKKAPKKYTKNASKVVRARAAKARRAKRG